MVYGIKCGSEIKQDDNHLGVNCHMQIVLYFDQSCFSNVVIFIYILQYSKWLILSQVLF